MYFLVVDDVFFNILPKLYEIIVWEHLILRSKKVCWNVGKEVIYKLKIFITENKVSDNHGSLHFYLQHFSLKKTKQVRKKINFA